MAAGPECSIRRGEGGVFDSVTHTMISGGGARDVNLDQGCDHIDRETFPNKESIIASLLSQRKLIYNPIV